ncbi:hypothetical protein [Streptomyces sp. NPDC006552]|uniref:hypothetical protein n=1 Tax=Streptomyces sp. NPDC006552 TaxID=3157179 RepID=UPI0033A0A3DC
MNLRLAKKGTAVCVLAGCSSESKDKREYRTPKSLCSIPVDADLLTPLLPEGKTVGVEEKNPVPSRSLCQVNVDGKTALITSQEWRERGDGVTDVADSLARIEGGEVTSDDKYLYAGTGAVGHTASCSNPRHKEHVLFTAIQLFADGHDDATSMKKLITAYTEAVERSDICS